MKKAINIVTEILLDNIAYANKRLEPCVWARVNEDIRILEGLGVDILADYGTDIGEPMEWVWIGHDRYEYAMGRMIKIEN